MKTKIYIATSLDGYIADKNGSVAWLDESISPNNDESTYETFINTIDTVILGGSTYDQIITTLSPDVWPYDGMHTYVFTSKKRENTHNITFLNGDVKNHYDFIKSNAKKDIWICGGANILNQLLDNNLVDKITISIIPIILGNGIKLFNEKEKPIKLKLIDTKSYNGFVDLNYEVLD